MLAALVLMLVGGLAMAFTTSWNGQIAGRLVAGAGGVLLNVQMTKMVADWFAGKEIATAMAIFVNSWPAGIALSLLALPADRHGLRRRRGPSRRGRADRRSRSCFLPRPISRRRTRVTAALPPGAARPPTR